jgi:hypothetical protein
VVAHYGKDKLDLVFINWIQPWHPQATWLHSALLAASLCDDKSLFWKLADLLYDKQDECTLSLISRTRARTAAHIVMVRVQSVMRRWRR